MTSAIAEFLKRGTAFARRYPDAVLAMPAPELAIEPNARARHLRSTCDQVRERMVMTARLQIEARDNASDLFARAQIQTSRQTERQTA